MIQALRVDERLVHGQIAMMWSKELGIDGIVVANDAAASDDTRKMVLKMAVPSGIKIIIKDVNSAIDLLQDPRASKMKLLVIVQTITDAVSVAKRINDIKYMNIGNVGRMTGEKNLKVLSKTVMLSEKEVAALKELTTIYPETALQGVPSEPRVLASKLV